MTIQKKDTGATTGPLEFETQGLHELHLNASRLQTESV